MLKIDRNAKSLIPLEPRSMKESGYWERRDIQEMICRSPQQFCDELAETVWIVGAEVEPTDFVQDRIDLLGVDRDGAAVVIELKRDSHKYQLLQALSYAGMVAMWEPKRFIEELRKFNHKWASDPKYRNRTFEDAKDELEDTLAETDIEAVNRSQRIVLLAEKFDYEVLVTAEWLTQKYDLDIRCYQTILSRHGGDDFLSCTRSYPPRELTEIAIRRRRKRETGIVEATDWSEALATIQSESVKCFFEAELRNGRPNSVKYRSLNFYIGDKRRFLLYAKRRWARVYQFGRFEDDTEFWNTRLGADGRVSSKANGNALRFYLTSAADLESFKRAADHDLAKTEFTSGLDSISENEERSSLD